MASKTSKILTHHIKDLRALIKYDKQYPPQPIFKPVSKNRTFTIEVVTGASMGTKKDTTPREGYKIVRGSSDTIHPIFWNSRKLRSTNGCVVNSEDLCLIQPTTCGLPKDSSPATVDTVTEKFANTEIS